MSVQFSRRLATWMAVGLVLVWLLPLPALAFEPAENDDFYLGFGSANIELRESNELLSGENVFGGIRIGLFWTVFLELGYGAVTYSDSVLVGTEQRTIDFRTTGPHGGLGFLIPIRAILLGFKAQRSVNNRWAEEITRTLDGTTISNVSGRIDYISYYVFTRFGDKGWFEVGVRRDQIKNTDSVLSNSFGPYLAVNFSIE